MGKSKQFEYFSHTADVKFRAYGKTLEKRFENAAYASFNVMFDPQKVKPLIKKEINIEAKKTESLLYDWIDEVLFYLDSEGWFLSKIESLKIKDNKLKSVVYGDDYKKYVTSGHVKGVTYSEMELTPEYVQVVLDI
jgi:SHS2 domain-containing protein